MSSYFLMASSSSVAGLSQCLYLTLGLVFLHSSLHCPSSLSLFMPLTSSNLCCGYFVFVPVSSLLHLCMFFFIFFDDDLRFACTDTLTSLLLLLVCICFLSLCQPCHMFLCPYYTIFFYYELQGYKLLLPCGLDEVQELVERPYTHLRCLIPQEHKFMSCYYFSFTS